MTAIETIKILAELQARATPVGWVCRDFPTAPGGVNRHWITDAIPDQDGKVVANAVAQVCGTNPLCDENAAFLVAVGSVDFAALAEELESREL